jgi:hypothetical protein
MWVETCRSVLCNKTVILTNSCLNGSYKHYETKRGVQDAILVVSFVRGDRREGQTLQKDRAKEQKWLALCSSTAVLSASREIDRVLWNQQVRRRAHNSAQCAASISPALGLQLISRPTAQCRAVCLSVCTCLMLTMLSVRLYLPNADHAV